MKRSYKMPKAHEVAEELRKFADCLDVEPEVAISCVHMYQYYFTKDVFLTMAKLLPRPLVKNYTGESFTLSYKSEALDIDISVPRDKVCTLVKDAQPAVYNCEPLLLADEMEKL
jgi:hypothetical protein